MTHRSDTQDCVESECNLSNRASNFVYRIGKLGDTLARYKEVTGFLHKTEECKHRRTGKNQLR